MLSAVSVGAQPPVGRADSNTETWSVHLGGLVTDALNGAALPWVHVILPGRGWGTVTDDSGRFNLFLPPRFREDSLQISSMGYRSRQYAVRELIVNESGRLPVIALDPSAIELQTLVIKPASGALELVREAIARIPENHGADPFGMSGFYRLVSHAEDSCIHISEAAFDLFHPAYGKSGEQLRLNRARKVRDLSVFNGMENIYFGLAPRDIFNLDPVRNSRDHEVLSKRGLKAHDFTLLGQVDMGGTPAWEITFDQREELRRAGYRGKLYLSIERLAFLRIEYGLSPSGIRYAKVGTSLDRAMMKMMGIDIRVLSDSVRISYRAAGSKRYLERVQEGSRIRVSSDKQGFDFIAEPRVDYLITQVDTFNVLPFAGEERQAAGRAIEFSVSDADPRFWESYNILGSSIDFAVEAAAIERRNTPYR